MDEYVHVTPPQSLATKPKRVQVPDMWTKEQASLPGPWNGQKAADQLLVKAEYGEKVIQLDMVKTCQDVYTWNALKSKVRRDMLGPIV